MTIKHIFFDLDRTLWDFEKNSIVTLTEIFNDFKLSKLGVSSVNLFIDKYKYHNNKLWDLYRDNKISKEYLRDSRFALALNEFNIQDSNLGKSIGRTYIEKSPLKTGLFPNTVEVLNYLFKKYKLHIITNGFNEVQHIKLKASLLNNFFENVITSEQVGVKKPNKKIFKYALENANALPEECVMIGDDYLADIVGAQNAGLKAIYFNPNLNKLNIIGVPEIKSLLDLKKLL